MTKEVYTEVIEVSVPINDIVFGQQGFDHLAGEYDTEARLSYYTEGYMIVEREWYKDFVKENLEVDLDEWLGEYTVEEAEGHLAAAMSKDKVLRYGIKGEKVVRV